MNNYTKASMTKRANKSPIASGPHKETDKGNVKRQKTLEKTKENTMDKKFDEFLQAFKDTSARTNAKLDDLMNKHESTDLKIDQLTTDLATIKNKIATLESAQAQNEMDFDLTKRDINILSADLAAVQQAALENNFVIQGLPDDLQEPKAFDVMTKIAQKLELDIQEADLKFLSLRKNRRTKTSFLTGKFYDGRQRNQLFKTAKERKPITVESIFPEISPTSHLRGKEINVRSQLTQTNRVLLAEAHKRNNNSFKFIWESDGRILMRKDHGTRPIEVRSTSQLIEILANEERQQRTNQQRSNGNHSRAHASSSNNYNSS